MDFASDITRLRKEGVSDDEILSGYRSIAPHDSSDIDKLLKEGVSANEIVSGIASRGPAAAPSAEPSNEDGWLTTGRKALQWGTAQPLVAAGSTARHINADFGLEDFGKKIAPENYEPATPKFLNSGGKGFGWKFLPRAALEALPMLAGTMATAEVSVPAALGLGAMTTFGPALDQRQENNGGKALTGTDYAAAGVDAAAGAVLNRFGAKGISDAALRGAGAAGLLSIPKAIATAGLKEGAASAGQSVVDQALTTAGTDKGLTIDPGEAVGQGVLGATLGAGARSATVGGDVHNAIRYAGGDQDARIRVADRFGALENPIRTPTEQAKALDTVEGIIKGDVSQAAGKAKGVIDATDGHEIVNAVRKTLETGQKVSTEQLQAVKDILSQHPDGVPLLNHITDYQELNSLRTRGTEGKGVFDGGMAGKFGFLLDPRQTTGKFLAGAGAAVDAGGAMALPMIQQLGVGGGLLAKVMAAQTAAYGGVKGIDKLMGNSNPVANYRDQFAGLNKGPGVQSSNSVQTASDLKELAKQAKARKNLDKQLENAVQRGAGEALKDATKKAKETDKAWNQNDKDRAQAERADPALSDKAWASQEQKLPKRAGEDALWDIHEKQQAAEAKAKAARDNNDAKALDEAEAALAELRDRQTKLDLDLKASELKAQAQADFESESQASRKAVEVDRAWKQLEKLKAGQRPSPALSDSAWKPQERSASPETKARQIEDLWSNAEGPKNSKEFDADHAQSVIEREYAKRDAAAESSIQDRIKEAAAKAKAAKKAEAKAKADQDYEEAKAQKAVAAEMNRQIEALKKQDAADQKASDSAKAGADSALSKALDAQAKADRASAFKEAEGLFSKPKAEAPKETKKTDRSPSASDKPAGGSNDNIDGVGRRGTFSVNGKTFDVPSSVKEENVPYYVEGAKRNQTTIKSQLERILGDHFDPSDGELLASRAYDNISPTRTADHARKEFESILEDGKISKEMRRAMLSEFEAKIVPVFSKKKNAG